jgi:hypothetical protein
MFAVCQPYIVQLVVDYMRIRFGMCVDVSRFKVEFIPFHMYSSQGDLENCGVMTILHAVARVCNPVSWCRRTPAPPPSLTDALAGPPQLMGMSYTSFPWNSYVIEWKRYYRQLIYLLVRTRCPPQANYAPRCSGALLRPPWQVTTDAEWDVWVLPLHDAGGLHAAVGAPLPPSLGQLGAGAVTVDGPVASGGAGGVVLGAKPSPPPLPPPSYSCICWAP